MSWPSDARETAGEGTQNRREPGLVRGLVIRTTRQCTRIVGRRDVMSLDPVADAIQNFDLRIALGIALCFLFFTLIV